MKISYWLNKLIPKCAVVILCVWAMNAHAGAWVQKKDAVLMINRIDWYVSTHAFDKHRHLHHAPRDRELQINPYFEYGVTERLTVGANPLFDDVDSTNSEAGLEDLEIFGRYLLWANDYSVVSTQMLLKFPGNVAGVTGARQFDFEWSLLGGTGGRVTRFPNNFWFLDVAGRIRKRFGSPADEIHLDWIVGLKTMHERLWYLIKQSNTIGLHNPSNRRGLNYDLNTIEPSVLYWVKRDIGLQFGVKQDFYGRNIGVGTAGFFALWLQF